MTLWKSKIRVVLCRIIMPTDYKKKRIRMSPFSFIVPCESLTYENSRLFVSVKYNMWKRLLLLFIQNISPFLIGSTTLANSSKQASVDQIWKRIVISEMSSNMQGSWRIRQSATKKPWGLHFTVGNPSCKDCCWIFNERLGYVYTLPDTFSFRHNRLPGIILYRFSQG